MNKKHRSRQLINDVLIRRGLPEVSGWSHWSYDWEGCPFMSAYIFFGNRLEVGLAMYNHSHFCEIEEVTCLFSKMDEHKAEIMVDHYQLYSNHATSIPNIIGSTSDRIAKNSDVKYKTKIKLGEG
jgi:hypothetical protein